MQVQLEVMPHTGVVILSAARTPIGRYGGSFRDIHPAELGAVAARAAIARAGLQPSDVDEVLMGHGRQAGSGPNPGRQVGHRAGVPHAAPAQTINKACASGLQAIVSGAQAIALGESEIVLAGGIESMSRMPYLVDAVDARWGHRMGNFALVDAMYRDGFQCPLSEMVMGETAERLAREYGITREASDGYALESQRRAGVAVGAGRFTAEIAPVTVEDEQAAMLVDRTSIRVPTPRWTPSRSCRPSLAAGVVTAGSSSGITDGGAALILASAEAARARGLTPRARLLGWASAGVDPRIMGIGPVPAVRRLEERTGLGVRDFDLIELNEAFAAQVLAVLQRHADPAGSAERQRRRHRARTPDRLHRRADCRDAAARARAAGGRARAGDALRQRRHGYGPRDRESENLRTRGSENLRIAVIPGDGIGVDVTAEAVKVVRAVADVFGRSVDLEMLPYGADHYLQTGVSLPPNGYAMLRDDFDAIYIGALGDPRIPDMRHARDILLGTRFELDLYVNYRPVRLLHERLCPLKNRGPEDVNFVVFRENTEGLYVNVGGRFKAGTEDEIAIQEEINTYKGVHRIIGTRSITPGPTV